MSASDVTSNVERARRWRHARNVLAIRLDNLGDVLMTTPALHALKTAVPERRITLLASPAVEAAVPYLPDVDVAIPYEAPWIKSGASRDRERDQQMIARI